MPRKKQTGDRKLRSYSIIVKHTFKATDADAAVAKTKSLIQRRAKIIAVECNEVPSPDDLRGISPYTVQFLKSEQLAASDPDAPQNPTLDDALGTLEQMPDDILSEAVDSGDDITDEDLGLLVEREVKALALVYGGAYRIDLLVDAYETVQVQGEVGPDVTSEAPSVPQDGTEG